MQRSSLSSGLDVSRVLTGLWQVADMERGGDLLDPDATATALVPYVEAGFTTFDMADHYGSAERIAGALRARLADPTAVQLLTKWVPPPGPLTRDDAQDAVQRALDRLGVERLDLLQFHAWNYDDPCYLDGLFYLDELRRGGLIRHLGLTNFDTAHLRVVVRSGIEIASNQVSFSVLDRRPLAKLVPFCVENDIKLLAYGTLAGGLLTDRYLDVPDPGMDGLPTWSLMKYRRFVEAAGGWEPFQAVLRVLGRVAERLGVSIANVATRYVIEQPAVAGVIVGARPGQTDHLEDNLALFELSLDEASRREIEAAVSALNTIPGDSGDEYRHPPFLTASGDLSHHVDTVPAPFDVTSKADGRDRALSGTQWEKIGGYCRALRSGSRILVSGTTATHGNRRIGGHDAGAQAHFVVDKIAGAIRSLGGRFEDIVRTRIFIRDLDDWEAVARVHGERFRDVLPANTLVQASLIGDEYLVEMEAEAIVPS
ncbi:MAG: aldo/keto reductase [Acidobacteria bacterium]|nr:aldo/keto reductase [Acidobacteriota bacterium]NIM60153.1 aldo/keto reductase [Acidobacteriota bacterium]NIO57822.1 aldo/keto reductase [Acidobacteriota bacterium]NIQ28831.1 aldo/keto reductase [Acidobacteriota bacterium]NIQ83289.1 aldo/keto reductase [Acidobacteriota bacterium]